MLKIFLSLFLRHQLWLKLNSITCILHAYGCNDLVNTDEVMGYDGVIDTFDTLTKNLKQVSICWAQFCWATIWFLGCKENLIASSAGLGLLLTYDTTIWSSLPLNLLSKFHEHPLLETLLGNR